jgi:hypothetical protein
VSENEVLRIILGAVALLRSTSLGEYSAMHLTFRGPCILIYSYNKTNEMHYFLKFIFGILHVSYRFSVHHQESSTVHTSIGICHTGFADCLLAGSGCAILIPLASSQHNLYDIHLLLCIQYLTPNDGEKICPKHVEFYSKNKFVKLVYLVGF